VAAEGDWQQFHQRLYHDGLDAETALSLLGEGRFPEQTPIPEWAETLQWILHAASQPVHVPSWLCDPSSPLPFADVLVPVVLAAHQHCIALTRDASTRLTDDAHLALQHALLARLSWLCAPVLMQSFAMFRLLTNAGLPAQEANRAVPAERATYQRFVAYLRQRGLAQVLLTYPVLGRLLATVVQQWIGCTATLLTRLTADLPAIAQTFFAGTELGPVVAIRTDLSDPHNNGHTVCVVHFREHRAVVYKPRDLGLDLAWGTLLAWLAQHDPHEPLHAPTVLARPHYGWVEYIEAQACTDVSQVARFYRRAGKFLCLAYVLQGTDCHSENSIARRDEPVAIDLETLCHPQVWAWKAATGSATAGVWLSAALGDSVLSTGYLPAWQPLPGGDVMSYGGLSRSVDREVTRWGYVHTNSDAMARTKTRQPLPPCDNLPVLDGRVVDTAPYVTELLQGFEDTYRTLSRCRDALLAGPLACFLDRQVRVVVRPTSFYGLLLERAIAPEHLRDGVDWSLQLDFAARFGDWDHPTADPLIAVLPLERQALTRLDIPYLTMRSGAHRLEGSPYTFAETSIEQIAARLQRLSDEDLQRQHRYIRYALGSAPHRLPYVVAADGEPLIDGAPAALTGTEALARARQYADILARTATCVNGGAAWLGVIPMLGMEQGQLGVLGYDLYAGTAGIALFLSAVEHVTGGDRRRGLAHMALAPIRQEIRDTARGVRLARRIGGGAGTGVGSLVYALSRCARLLEDPGLLEDAVCAARLLDPARMAAERHFDVISGAAGAILGLLALQEAPANGESVERAAACAQVLLEHQITTGPCAGAWPGGETIPLTGMSHGAAGIAYALCRLYQVTTEPRLLAAAEAAMQFENSLYAEEHANWPDLRQSALGSDGSTQYSTCQWCHGATGIGLARLGMLPVLSEPAVHRDIRRALARTNAMPLGEFDHLCCGNFGRIELPFVAAQRLGRDDFRTMALQRAAAVMNRGNTQSRGRWPLGDDDTNPGFFTGIAGLGYALLRLTHPERLPSVLLWE
jgi:type 2 lantibiotic biosynthesis protein LanM